MSSALAIEFLGLPGGGKSACAAALCDALRMRGKKVWRSGTEPGRCPFFTTLWVILLFVVGHPWLACRYTWSCLRTSLPGQMLRWVLLDVYNLAMAGKAARDHEIVILDENRFQRLFSLGIELPDPDRLFRGFIPTLPRRDLLLNVVASPRTALERLETRTKLKRLGACSKAERLAFLERAATFFERYTTSLRSAGYQVLEISGEDNLAEVVRTTVAVVLDASTCELQPVPERADPAPGTQPNGRTISSDDGDRRADR